MVIGDQFAVFLHREGTAGTDGLACRVIDLHIAHRRGALVENLVGGHFAPCALPFQHRQKPVHGDVGLLAGVEPRRIEPAVLHALHHAGGRGELHRRHRVRGDVVPVGEGEGTAGAGVFQHLCGLIEHLGRLLAGDAALGTEGAVLITVDDAQGTGIFRVVVLGIGKGIFLGLQLPVGDHLTDGLFLHHFHHGHGQAAELLAGDGGLVAALQIAGHKTLGDGAFHFGFGPVGGGVGPCGGQREGSRQG